MITAVKAYYDGRTFVPLQDFAFKPSQQVLIVVDEETSQSETPVDLFLKLSWQGDESAEEILSAVQSSRKNSSRFGETNEFFD